MAIILDPASHIFRFREAERLVEVLQSDDPEWKYEIVPVPGKAGFAQIGVLDEDGRMIGKL